MPKLANGKMGSPAWRKAGRPAKGEMPVKEQAEANLDDLHGKSAQELKEIAEVSALRALIGQVRKPTRHATAVTSAARSLLDFSSSKPAQKIDVDSRVTQVESEAETARRRREERLARA